MTLKNTLISLAYALVMLVMGWSQSHNLGPAQADPISMTVMAVLAIGMLVASMLLMPKPKDLGKGKNPPTTLATRGEYLNYVIGTRRTGYLFAHAWKRKSKDVDSGGKDFSGGSGTGKVWFENGWHAIALGPATSLEAIFIAGEQVWDTRIESSVSPSGSTFYINPKKPAKGSFTIYWGEATQPINASLAASLGINSQWPYLFHIVWNQYKLGYTPVWPQIEYVYSCPCLGTSLPSDYYIGTAPDGGINAAHALHQLLTAPFPHGLNIDPGLLDGTTLEALGEAIEAEGIGANIWLQSGSSYEAALQSILIDFGIQIPWVGRRQMFLSQRPPTTTVPELTDSIVLPPDIQKTIRRGEQGVSRPIFIYKNKQDWSFNDYDVKDEDSGEASEVGPSAQRIALETITVPEMADIVAGRRSQENFINTSIKVEVSRGARLLVPGQLFVRNNQRFRVMGTLWKDDTASVELDAILDTYGLLPTGDTQTPIYPDPPSLGVADDPAFAWLYLSEFGPNSIVVFRTRAHQQIAGSYIYGSANEGSYLSFGNQDAAAAGGLIESEIAASTADIITTGPVFEDENGDVPDLPDYSEDTTSWTSGLLLALIDSELFFVESMSVQEEDSWTPDTAYIAGDTVIPSGTPTGLRYICTVGGTSASTEPSWPTTKLATVTDNDITWEAHYFAYTANNMIRARLGTSAAQHLEDARIYLLPRGLLQVLSHDLIAPGNSLCIKSVPFSDNEIADIASITEVCALLEPQADDPSIYILDNDGNYIITQLGDNLVE